MMQRRDDILGECLVSQILFVDKSCDILVYPRLVQRLKLLFCYMHHSLLLGICCHGNAAMLHRRYSMISGNWFVAGFRDRGNWGKGMPVIAGLNKDSAQCN